MPAAEADSPWAAGTAGWRQVPGASPQPRTFEQGIRASGTYNSSSAEFSACSSTPENPRPQGYHGGHGDYSPWFPTPVGSPRPCPPWMDVVVPWISTHGPSHGVAGHWKAGCLSQGADALSPQSTTDLHALGTACQ